MQLFGNRLPARLDAYLKNPCLQEGLFASGGLWVQIDWDRKTIAFGWFH